MSKVTTSFDLVDDFRDRQTTDSDRVLRCRFEKERVVISGNVSSLLIVLSPRPFIPINQVSLLKVLS